MLKEYIKRIINEKKDVDKITFLIALYPSKETISKIVTFRNRLKKIHKFSSMHEIPPEKLHATIRWWEAQDYKVAPDLSKIKLEPIEAEASDVDILGDSLSIMLESAKMHTLFNRVDNLLQSKGAPPSDYPNYIPHLALFYGDWEDVIVDQVTEVPDFPIIFDHIKMKDGNEDIYTHISLT